MAKFRIRVEDEQVADQITTLNVSTQFVTVTTETDGNDVIVTVEVPDEYADSVTAEVSQIDGVKNVQRVDDQDTTVSASFDLGTVVVAGAVAWYVTEKL